MFRTLLPASALMCVILLPLTGHAAQLDELKSLTLELPSSDMTFPDGPGADAMNSNCLACHSADHTLNQPTLPRKVWQEVVDSSSVSAESNASRRRIDRRLSGAHRPHNTMTPAEGYQAQARAAIA
jgi:hypothetical protein